MMKKVKPDLMGLHPRSTTVSAYCPKCGEIIRDHLQEHCSKCGVEFDWSKVRGMRVKTITRGNCMMCGKELTEGLFFCKECEDKGK